jgi:hypothetical protein
MRETLLANRLDQRTNRKWRKGAVCDVCFLDGTCERNRWKAITEMGSHQTDQERNQDGTSGENTKAKLENYILDTNIKWGNCLLLSAIHEITRNTSTGLWRFLSPWGWDDRFDLKTHGIIKSPCWSELDQNCHGIGETWPSLSQFMEFKSSVL